MTHFLLCTGLSLAEVWALKVSHDDAVSAVRADGVEGQGAYEGLISLEMSAMTAVLSINGRQVSLGASLVNISQLIFYLIDSG